MFVSGLQVKWLLTNANPDNWKWKHLLKSKYSRTCVKQPLSKRLKNGFQDQLSLNAGQKYCRMLQGEHSAILLTFIKLPFVIKMFVLSIFELPFYTGFTVNLLTLCILMDFFHTD